MLLFNAAKVLTVRLSAKGISDLSHHHVHVASVAAHIPSVFTSFRQWQQLFFAHPYSDYAAQAGSEIFDAA